MRDMLPGPPLLKTMPVRWGSSGDTCLVETSVYHLVNPQVIGNGQLRSRPPRRQLARRRAPGGNPDAADPCCGSPIEADTPFATRNDHKSFARYRRTAQDVFNSLGTAPASR